MFLESEGREHLGEALRVLGYSTCNSWGGPEGGYGVRPETSREDVEVSGLEPRQVWPGLTFWGKRAAGLSPEPSALDNPPVLRVSCCPWVLRCHACPCDG